MPGAITQVGVRVRKDQLWRTGRRILGFSWVVFIRILAAVSDQRNAEHEDDNKKPYEVSGFPS
jgi:hypothetical protein